jgi:hypothetical protein
MPNARNSLLAAAAVFACALYAPALATAASPPSIFGESVSGITEHGATLEGSINPMGLETSYRFLLEHAGNAIPLPSGELPASIEAHTVRQDVNQAGVTLEGDTEYRYSLEATSSGGTTRGPLQAFTTAPASAPVIEGESVTHITSADATVEAQINPGGLATTYEVWVGAYPECIEERLEECENTPKGTIVGTIPAGFAPQKVSADIANAWHKLKPGASYIFSVNAVNQDGTAYGANQQFTTRSDPHFYSNGALIGVSPVPLTGWGKIKLESGLGKLECTNLLYASAWNPEAGGAGRADVEAWGANPARGYPCNPCPLCEGAFRETVFVTAESPLEFVEHEGEYCTQRGEKLTECPNSAERTTSTVLTGLKRGFTSVPWNVELRRVFNAAIESEVVLQRTGLAEFGESGTSAEKNTRCYPKNAKGEPASFTEVPKGCIVLDFIVPAFLSEYVFYGTLEPEMVEGIANGLTPARLVYHGAESGKLVSEADKYGEATIQGEVKILGAGGQQLIDAR